VQSKTENKNFENSYDQNEFDDDFYTDLVEEKKNCRSRRHRPPRMNARHERAFKKSESDE